MITRRSMLAATGLALATAGRAGAQERTGSMMITRSGSEPSTKGSTDYFTGSVRIDAPFQGSAPARVAGARRDLRARRPHRLAYASARPDADRHGRLRLGPARRRPEGGDPPRRRGLDSAGEKHWHGATAATAMTHIAIAEALDGKSVDWMEKVSDDQFGGR